MHRRMCRVNLEENASEMCQSLNREQMSLLGFPEGEAFVFVTLLLLYFRDVSLRCKVI